MIAGWTVEQENDYREAVEKRNAACSRKRPRSSSVSESALMAAAEDRPRTRRSTTSGVDAGTAEEEFDAGRRASSGDARGAIDRDKDEGANWVVECRACALPLLVSAAVTHHRQFHSNGQAAPSRMETQVTLQTRQPTCRAPVINVETIHAEREDICARIRQRRKELSGEQASVDGADIL